MNCKHEDCDKGISKRGYCNAHYLRLIRYGSSYGGKKIKNISCNHIDSNGTKLDWRHSLYNTYVGMYSRCYDENNVKYNIYGGRGIRVADRWLGACGFHNFVNDMGNRPKGYSLDRLNSELGYTPSNCKWSSIHEQNANKRTNGKNVGVYEASDNRRLKWRTTLVIKGKEIAGKSFRTEHEAVEFITKVREDNHLYVG